LREETGLTPASLELLRQGKPYSFVDDSIGREWTINPFAFRLKSQSEGGGGEAAIKIDWEHESWSWFDPLEVSEDASFGGVPRLVDSLQRVWFERELGEAVSGVLDAGLRQLRTDYHSGARQLATKALTVLRDVIVALDNRDPDEEWWRKVRLAAWHLWKNGRESMGAAVVSAIMDALKSTEETLRQHHDHPGSKHSMKWRDVVVEGLDRQLALRETSGAKPIADAFVRYLSDNFGERLEQRKPLHILTLSESSTITEALKSAIRVSGFVLDLRILESRPLFEGVSLAAKLAADDLPSKDMVETPNDCQNMMTIFTDASAALASEAVDIVVIGADRISGRGAVSNKMGSLPAILSAKHVSGSRVLVLSDSEKVAAPAEEKEHVVEDNDPMQLAASWASDENSSRLRAAAASISGNMKTDVGRTGTAVRVRNVFFEWVPPELIDTYVTEYGIWGVEDVQKHSQRLAAEEKRLFKDL
jgi:translation initiation factor 2B subunit (eIF-2B alpha/beta/delta family)